MIRIFAIGLWICAVALGSLFFAVRQNDGPSGEVQANGGAFGGLDYVKTDVMSVPIISNGSVAGYVVAQLVYTVDSNIRKNSLCRLNISSVTRFSVSFTAAIRHQRSRESELRGCAGVGHHRFECALPRASDQGSVGRTVQLHFGSRDSRHEYARRCFVGNRWQASGSCVISQRIVFSRQLAQTFFVKRGYGGVCDELDADLTFLSPDDLGQKCTRIEVVKQPEAFGRLGTSVILSLAPCGAMSQNWHSMIKRPSRSIILPDRSRVRCRSSLRRS